MGAIDTILNGLRQVLPSFAKSDGSLEAKIIDVVGSYADSEAVERRNTLEVINNALSNQRVTTQEYYRRVAVAFQLGYSLEYDPVNQRGYYPTITPQAQIVRQAFIVGAYPRFTLLVNVLGEDGHLRKLTTDELASFITYFEAFQPLGMRINVTSMEVAKISDPNIVVYVKAGADATATAQEINQLLKDHEATLRTNNTVTLSEIEDVIQKAVGVRAVGFGDIHATEVRLNGEVVVTRPIEGVFALSNGAFSFTTEITSGHIRPIT